jgi:hypothetical protein
MLSRKTETFAFATQKIGLYLRKSMIERELRASLAAVGPLLPVLVYRGRVVDGEKRDRICSELGLIPRTQILHSTGELCAALWVLHPERAIAEAQLARPGLTLPELAELCSTRPSDVALALAGQRGKPPRGERSPRRTQGQKSVLIQFWAEPQFKHFVKLAGERAGLDLSATLRVSAWEFVQRNMPRAATEGSARAPGSEWVKPSERRLRSAKRAG